jgi:hypothetical protein
MFPNGCDAWQGQGRNEAAEKASRRIQVCSLACGPVCTGMHPNRRIRLTANARLMARFFDEKVER